MEARDALLSLAEFSIALAGFTGVVVVFGSRAGGWHPLDRYRISIILWASIGPAFFSLLPVGFEMLGMDGPDIWRAGSFLLAIYLVGAGIVIHRGSRVLDEASRGVLSDTMFLVNNAGLALCVVAQVANALGLGIRTGPGAFFLSLVFCLFVAAYVFARMVTLRPDD